MIITLREVLASIRTFGVTAESKVVVFGCGPVGVTFTKFMNLLGVSQITVIDLDEAKREIALINGATQFLHGASVDAVAILKEQFPDGVDFVIDAVGHEAVINQGLKMIRDRGNICVYGVPGSTKLNLDFTDAPYNWNLVFQQMPSKREEGEAHEQVLTWLRNGDVVLKDYISHYLPFDQVLEAFELLAMGQIPLKCVIKF